MYSTNITENECYCSQDISSEVFFGAGALLLLSGICWVLDQLFCEYVREYQLHAVWHAGTALSMLLGLGALLL